MAKRIGIFADVSNIYYCVGKKYDGRKLDYKKYLEFTKDLGEIQKAIAYGAQLGDEAEGFIFRLKKIGYIIKYKTPKAYHNDSVLRRKADWDVGIAVDMISMLGHFDLIILGTADGDLVPAVEYIRARDVDIVAFACGISRDLKDAATKYIEIPESLLEDR